MKSDKIAVLIPCYNEAITIAKVIDDFRRELPESQIYVYDNNSSDETSQIATAHGAIVRTVCYQGKGNVVRAMFREIDADYYVMTDGDDTYPASDVHKLLEPLKNGECDMSVGDRRAGGVYDGQNKRQFHGFGNNLVRWLVTHLYGVTVNDVMTGYRGFTKAFVKNCPVLSEGFEIETELTIHCIDKHWRLLEFPVSYQDRPEGSYSKLNTVSDGIKVLRTIGSLFKDFKPLVVFFTLGLILFIIGLILGIGVIIDYMNTGFVERFPTAILSVGFVVSGLLCLFCGLILDTVVKGIKKQYEIDVYRQSAVDDRK